MELEVGHGETELSHITIRLKNELIFLVVSGSK
jgi:hypothetical protein